MATPTKIDIDKMLTETMSSLPGDAGALGRALSASSLTAGSWAGFSHATLKATKAFSDMGDSMAAFRDQYMLTTSKAAPKEDQSEQARVRTMRGVIALGGDHGEYLADFISPNRLRFLSEYMGRRRHREVIEDLVDVWCKLGLSRGQLSRIRAEWTERDHESVIDAAEELLVRCMQRGPAPETPRSTYDLEDQADGRRHRSMLAAVVKDAREAIKFTPGPALQHRMNDAAQIRYTNDVKQARITAEEEKAAKAAFEVQKAAFAAETKRLRAEAAQADLDDRELADMLVAAPVNATEGSW